MNAEIDKAKRETKVEYFARVGNLMAQLKIRCKEMRELEEALRAAKRDAEGGALDGVGQTDGLRMELVHRRMNEETTARKAAEVLGSSLRQSTDCVDTISALCIKLKETEKCPGETRLRPGMQYLPCPRCFATGGGAEEKPPLPPRTCPPSAPAPC